jgi:uncharacterized protein (DUF697 family)
LSDLPLEALRRLSFELRAPRQYRDTIARLMRGNFQDLTPEQRRDKVEQVIQICASAAMVLSAMPVPFLDLPVHAAMVRAVARVHGMDGSERQLVWKLAAGLGLGFTIREGLRFVPFAGNLTRLTRAYGAAWALGQAADLYFEHAARKAAPPDPESAQRTFALTLERKSEEQAVRLQGHAVVQRLRELKMDWDAGRIDEATFRSRVEVLLAYPEADDGAV